MILIEKTNQQTINVDPQLSGRLQQSLVVSPPLDQNPIIDEFYEFISKLSTTKIQNDSAYDIAEQLIKADPSLKVIFEQADEEHEILFVAENDVAQNIIVLDEDGDIMISHSPFLGEGWRQFIDHSEIDPESVVYAFLSL